MIRGILFVVFLVVPFVEALIFIQVGQEIGFGWTLLAIIGISVAGAALVRREGLRAWGRFRDALAAGRAPATEVVDGALVLIGGTLLLTPGFATDAVGLLLLVPATRSVANRALRSRARAAFGIHRVSHSRSRADDGVADVEVVSIERNPRHPDDRPA